MNINDELVLNKLVEMLIVKCEIINNIAFNNATKQKIESFKESNISIKMKIEILSLLYQLAIYSDGYIAQDPKVSYNRLQEALKILEAKDDNDAIDKIQNLDSALKEFKESETNVIATAIRKIKNESNKDIIF